MIDLIQFSVFLVAHHAIRGACEAMTMSEDGVRNHHWFRWYHRLRIAELAAFALVVFAASRLTLSWGTASVVLGAALAGWEVFEVMYSRGRYGLWIAPLENMFGGGWYATGTRQVISIHAARTLLAATLIIGGMV
jgi:hypothetical protein